MKPRIIFIHGNGTMHWSDSYAKKLKVELEKLGFNTFFETFPDSIIAREKYWIPFLKDHVKAGEDDVIVGWSSGAVAAMRYAEENKIKGSVLISPCYTDLGEDSEKISGYYNRPWKWENIKYNQTKIALVYGDNDPFIPQEEFEHIAEHLEPVVLKIHNGGHFIDYQEFPEVFEYIKKNYL